MLTKKTKNRQKWMAILDFHADSHSWWFFIILLGFRQDFSKILLCRAFLCINIFNSLFSVDKITESQNELPYWWKKPVKSEQLFSGDQYFSPTSNNYLTKINTYQKYLSVTFSSEWKPNNGNLKKQTDLLNHNLFEWRWVGKGS